MIETVGAFVIAVSVLIFLVNIIVTGRKRGATRRADPWDGRSLEWSIPSPPPEYNFAEIPRSRPATTGGTASTPRTPRAGSCALPAGGAVDEADLDVAHGRAGAPASTCRRRRSTRSSSPLGLPFLGYAAVFHNVVAG